jgi:hypothetical protein
MGDLERVKAAKRRREEFLEKVTLNRVVKWEHDRLIYEADDKHVKKILFELGIDENNKGHDMPTAKDYDTEGGEDDEELEAHEARRYRLWRRP